MIHVAVLGDMGLDKESDNTVASLTGAVRAGTYDFVLHAGDIACTSLLTSLLALNWKALLTLKFF